MYFWNTRRLKEQLRGGALPTRDSFNYLFALITIISVIEIVEAWKGTGEVSPTRWQRTSAIILALVSVGGTAVCYRANGGAAGHDFPARALALGWVVGIRVAFVFLVTALSFGIAEVLATGRDEPSSWWIELFVIAATIGYYWRLVLHLSELRGSLPPVGQPA